jgi:hypothetical protein
MSNYSEDYGDLDRNRTRRTRIVAWSVIISMVLVGGGATVITWLFG